MIRRLFFFIGEAFIGMKRSSMMIVISLATIFISLVCFGLIVNMTLIDLSHQLNSKLEIRIFLKDGLTKKENMFKKMLVGCEVLSLLGLNIKRLLGIYLKNNIRLGLTAMDLENPLPHAISVKLKRGANIDYVANLISNYAVYIDEVVYGSDMAKHVKDVSRLIIYVGLGLVGVLSLATFNCVILFG